MFVRITASQNDSSLILNATYILSVWSEVGSTDIVIVSLGGERQKPIVSTYHFKTEATRDKEFDRIAALLEASK